MDDFLLIHQNKEYLKECLNKIKSYLIKENLYLNNKTEIYSIYNSINFLGYRFKLNSKKINIIIYIVIIEAIISIVIIKVLFINI